MLKTGRPTWTRTDTTYFVTEYQETREKKIHLNISRFTDMAQTDRRLHLVSPHSIATFHKL